MNTYDEDTLEEVKMILSVKPTTIRELSRRFEKSERTIKRWFCELRDRGYRVVRDGAYVACPYFIVGQVGRRTSAGDHAQS